MSSPSGFQPYKIVLSVGGRFIGACFVALRFYARKTSGAKLSWDDWLLFVSVVTLLVPLSILDIYQVVHIGWGKRITWIASNHPNLLPLFAKTQYADLQFYAPIVAFTKCSILAFYIRVFGANRSLRRFCYFQIALVCIWCIVTLLVFMLQCEPVHLGWSMDRSSGSCMRYSALFIGTNVVNVVADFVILLTPLPTLWTLQLQASKKRMITAIFILGTGACILSTVRLVKLSHLTFEDPSLDGIEGSYWSSLEGNFGLVCACLPTLGPVVSRIQEKLNNTVWGRNKSLSDTRSLVHRRITRTTDVEVYDEPTIRTVDLESYGDSSVGQLEVHYSSNDQYKVW